MFCKYCVQRVEEGKTCTCKKSMAASGQVMNQMDWDVEVDGVPYKIEFNKNTISVNGNEPMKLKALRWEQKFPDMLYYIPVGGKEAILHVNKMGAVSLEFEGKDCVTGEDYVKAVMPVWAWIFVILHGINFFTIVGGAIGGALIALMFMLTTTVASNSKMTTTARVLTCAGIWVLATMGEVVLASLIREIFY